MKPTMIDTEKIRIDGGTQPRARIDYDTASDYMDMMMEGVKFPPVIVFYDGTNYWLADGFHRIEAALRAELPTIDCEVHQGTLEDAQWYSFSANITNGLRRTNEDKQRAVQAALKHPKSAGLSDNEIAKHVGVDHKTVARWRESILGNSQDTNRTATRNGKTYQMDVGNIGKREPKPPSRDVDASGDQSTYKLDTDRSRVIANANYRKMCSFFGQIQAISDGIKAINWDAGMSMMQAENAAAWIEEIKIAQASLRELAKKVKIQSTGAAQAVALEGR